MRWNDKAYKNGKLRCSLVSDDGREHIVVYFDPKAKEAPFTFSCYEARSVIFDIPMEATNIQDAKNEAVNWLTVKCKVQIAWRKSQIQEDTKTIEELQTFAGGVQVKKAAMS